MRSIFMQIPAGELERFGFGEFLAEVRRQGAGEVECLSCYETGALFMLDRATDPEAIRDVDCVLRVSPFDSAVGCVVEVTAPRYGWLFEEYATDFFIDGPITVDDDGVTLNFVATQDVITALQSDLDEELGSGNVDCEIQKVGRFDGRSDPLEGLTSRQREVLERAFEAGYYETPREASSEELAAQLGLDKSTLLEHLQRAENNIVSSLFAERA